MMQTSDARDQHDDDDDSRDAAVEHKDGADNGSCYPGAHGDDDGEE